MEPKQKDQPLPSPPTTEPEQEPARPKPDPTRFGDWEMNGRCIDF